MNDFGLRPMTEADRSAVIKMMRGFYASEAVYSNGSEKVFNNDVSECVSDSPFASGYVFIRPDGSVCGYSMLAHSFSTEYGKPVVWIEDLFIEEDARGNDLADKLFDLIMEKYPDHAHRLEVEEFNLRAIRTYKKNGFETLPYSEMIRVSSGDASAPEEERG